MIDISSIKPGDKATVELVVESVDPDGKWLMVRPLDPDSMCAIGVPVEDLRHAPPPR